ALLLAGLLAHLLLILLARTLLAGTLLTLIVLVCHVAFPFWIQPLLQQLMVGYPVPSFMQIHSRLLVPKRRFAIHHRARASRVHKYRQSILPLFDCHMLPGSSRNQSTINLFLACNHGCDRRANRKFLPLPGSLGSLLKQR